MSSRARARSGAAEVYRRELPGGGYAAIEMLPPRGFWGWHTHRARIILERRALDSRRLDHQPLVVIEARGRDRSEVLDELFPVVLSNTALAEACLSCVPARAVGNREIAAR